MIISVFDSLYNIDTEYITEYIYIYIHTHTHIYIYIYTHNI